MGNFIEILHMAAEQNRHAVRCRFNGVMPSLFNKAAADKGQPGYAITGGKFTYSVQDQYVAACGAARTCSGLKVELSGYTNKFAATADIARCQ